MTHRQPLTEKISDILSSESPLTLLEIVKRVRDFGWEPPTPNKDVTPYVSQALLQMKQRSGLQVSKNSEGKNQYHLEKKRGNG